MDAVNKWLENGGSDKITKAATVLGETAIGVGVAIGKGILTGVVNYFVDHPIAGAVVGGIATMKVAGSATLLAAASSGTAIGVALAAAAAGAILSGIVTAVNKAMDYVEKRNKELAALNGTPYARAMTKVENTPKGKPVYSSGSMTAYEPSWWDKAKQFFTNPFSHYNGIDNVPYDGYKAILHKGEKVVPAHQNRNGGGTTVTIPKLADTIIVREEADIDRLAYALAQQIKGAAVGMA
jgi:hypothetical protein